MENPDVIIEGSVEKVKLKNDNPWLTYDLGHHFVWDVVINQKPVKIDKRPDILLNPNSLDAKQ